jgi:hypothetical protein
MTKSNLLPTFAGFLLGLLYDPEDGRNIFLRNVVNFYWTTQRHVPKDNLFRN